ncbi:MAG: hypothetical protein GWP05_03895 [Anaerolineaceae bacterium]|nr:hypothetical protein [Anaerolineaceae bacterium]
MVTVVGGAVLLAVIIVTSAGRAGPPPKRPRPTAEDVDAERARQLADLNRQQKEDARRRGVEAFWQRRAEAERAAAEERRQAAERKASKGITLAQYRMLHLGIYHSKVIRLVGYDGIEASASQFWMPDITRSGYGGGHYLVTRMIRYQNPDGSNAILTFQNDKLTLKAQHGLK